MTNEEAINAVKTWILPMRKTCNWGDMANEFLDAVEVLLKHAMKYEWHDLCKNPEDLPDNPRLVLTKIELENWNYEVSRYMEFTNTCMWMNQKAQPIAWRYIEPMEEVDE